MQDVVFPPPLANGWQWGSHNGGSYTRLNSPMASPAPGKVVGHGGVKVDENSSEL